MANARVIRKHFFNDPKIAGNYNIKERYFIIGLACVSEDYGRFWWNSHNIKSVIYPTDRTSVKWINNILNKLLNNGILCQYEVEGEKYGHFIDWFDKKFALRQRLDHPKPDQLPDCKIHLMQDKNTRKKREISPTIQSNLNKSNLNKSSGSYKKIIYQPHQFKDDKTGNAKLGYCSKCSKVDFYSLYDVREDSKCCNAQVVPAKTLCVDQPNNHIERN